MIFLLFAIAMGQAGVDVRVSGVRHLTAPLAYFNPSLNMKGVIQPSSGNRLDIVEIALGATPIEADVAGFMLVSDGGLMYSPVGIGGGANLLFPIARLPIGQEV